MVSVEQANEIVAKMRELEMEAKSHEGLVQSCTTHEPVER